MFQRLLFLNLLLSTANGAHGLVLSLPKPTLASYNYLIDGWTPKPTAAPFALHTDPFAVKGLVRRQSASVETCAWSYVADASSYSSLSCSDGYACAYWTSYFACCTLVNGVYADYCSSATTCLGYQDNTYVGSSKLTTNDQVLCGADQQYCTTVWVQNGGPWYSGLDCGAEEGVTLTYYYNPLASSVFPPIPSVPAQGTSNPPPSTSAPTPPSSSSDSPQSSSQPESSATTSTPASSDSESSSSSSSSGSEGQSSATDRPTVDDPVAAPPQQPTISFSPSLMPPTSPTGQSNDGDGSSSNTGAIAGGTVGGVAVVAAIAGGIGFLAIRKRRQRVQPVREISHWR